MMSKVYCCTPAKKVKFYVSKEEDEDDKEIS